MKFGWKNSTSKSDESFGIDIIGELSKILSEQIAKEIDKEILNTILNMPGSFKSNLRRVKGKISKKYES